MSQLARTTRRTTRITAAAAGLPLALSLSACGAGSDHNDADVAFATDMLPHHAQALDMVELTEGRTLDPAVEQLAQDIRDAQAPEIDTMSGWLTSWDEPVPDPSQSMEGMSSDESPMEGMMSADQMTSLDQASSDEEFQTMWLELMIEHHTGAVAMARTEQADGDYGPAIDLAGDIVTSQTAEIETMKGLLSS